MVIAAGHLGPGCCRSAGPSMSPRMSPANVVSCARRSGAGQGLGLQRMPPVHGERHTWRPTGRPGGRNCVAKVRAKLEWSRTVGKQEGQKAPPAGPRGPPGGTAGAGRGAGRGAGGTAGPAGLAGGARLAVQAGSQLGSQPGVAWGPNSVRGVRPAAARRHGGEPGQEGRLPPARCGAVRARPLNVEDEPDSAPNRDTVSARGSSSSAFPTIVREQKLFSSSESNALSESRQDTLIEGLSE